MEKNIKTFQGNSNHTYRKEFEIQGVTTMRFHQYKSPYFKFRKIICADVFCGTGTNVIGDEIVEGSPLKMLNGFQKANNGKLKSEVGFWFSDIRKNACLALNKLIQGYSCNDITIEPRDAKDAINILAETLYQYKDIYLFLILDPNGPKDFPKEEVNDLVKAFHNRVDIIPYISATSIKRVINARDKAKMDFKGWLGEIENFDTGFVSCLTDKNRDGWIRAPIKENPQQWTMIPTFGRLIPNNGWEKQGYYKLNSLEGKNAIKFYCGG